MGELLYVLFYGTCWLFMIYVFVQPFMASNQ